jgi:tRNA dimethylallyltransferase
MASDALAITGPTATGKTAVALEVAARIGGEIVSMDSRQVYRGLDIGTAKATADERARIPQHGLDLVDPDERYSAGRFARDALAWIAAIRERGRLPILAGGTGFFLRALLQPLFREPPLDPATRARLGHFLRALPDEHLAAWARALDPDRARQPRDRQRLTRVIEVALLTGHPLSWWHARAPEAPPAITPLIIVLDLPREVLYARINERVEDMVRRGLVDEVRGLLARGYGLDAPGLNATGYIELLPHLRGERTLEEAKTLVQNATRAYARRQLTWLRNQLPPGAVWLDAQRGVGELADRIVAEWRRQRA